VALSRAAAEKMRPEVEVLLHRQRRLECVLVAKIVGLLADGELPITALELEPPLLRPHQARDQAKQGGLAHAIGAGDQQRFAPARQQAQRGRARPPPPDRRGGATGRPPSPPPPPRAPSWRP